MDDVIKVHFDALKHLVTGDDLETWKKQYPRTANAVLTNNPTCFDLPAGVKAAVVEGKTVTIGDYVSFKSDIEQTGKIVDIKDNGKTLCLEDEDGFSGAYLRYATYTEEPVDRCWVE